MATYGEKFEAAQRGIDNFYRLLKIYDTSKSNNGWVGPRNIFSNITLADFENFISDKKDVNTNINATLFDVPMHTKGYDKYGKYGYGIPSDIGFCRNIDCSNCEVWSEHTVGETCIDWVSICYGKDKFVAIGYNQDGNDFAYSTDGINWVEGKISNTNRYWCSVCYGNGMFVAIASNSNIFAYSTDGINWVEGNLGGIDKTWASVCYGKDKFVAVSFFGDVAYSENGINWYLNTNLNGTNLSWASVCYGKDKFVAVSQGDTAIGYSYDGINWVKEYIDTDIDALYNICYGKDKFVILPGTETNKYLYSDDGINWTSGEMGPYTTASRIWKSICYGNNKFIAIAYDGNAYAYSTNGIRWRINAVDKNSNNVFSSICYGNNKFIATELNSNKFASYSVEKRVKCHKPLYTVESYLSAHNKASATATAEVGGYITYSLNADGKVLKIYPNGSSNPIEVYPPDNDVWNNNGKFIIETANEANYNHLITCFVTISTDSGVHIFVTPNFINWNDHHIIENLTDDKWKALTGISTDIQCGYTDFDKNIVQNIIQKYFRILPNNNYLVMYPGPMYDNTDTTTMVKMYSPWQNDPLMIVKDPYDSTEDYRNKAINGFTSYLTENGEIVLYYNNRAETPMVLYHGRTVDTFDSPIYQNYKKSIIEAPKVAKLYGTPEEVSDDIIAYKESVDGVSVNCAISLCESKNGSLSDNDIPAASVGLALNDAGDHVCDNEVEEFKHYNQVELFIEKKIDMMDNIDVDFNEHIYCNSIPGEKLRNGEITPSTLKVETGDGTKNIPLPYVYDNCTVEVNFPKVAYNNNLRHRVTVFGNSLFSDTMKLTNNPVLNPKVSDWNDIPW